ncbi:MAG: KUP/HAK/KT family potassium transporter [Bacteroidetes bacterium]|nr:KUP/HAK/KT family potassium transporter [Bacteroidota bacterium]
MQDKNKHISKVSAAGLLVTLGIIFGDIGTSPLYVLKAIVGDSVIDADIVLGGLSCIFWTLTIQTTVKYVMLTLKADNNGEGGIFALFTLLKRMNKKWLVYIAVIGGSTLLADGFITPPISVTSALEGLRVINPSLTQEDIIPYVIGIIALLFVVQQFGTQLIGKFFGPIMLIWFGMLGILGAFSISNDLSILKALNPYYAYNLLVNHPEGFWLLGAVFLCTTGAEALYSDLGHCGRENIRFSWFFVKTMLLLNYFGQGAALMKLDGLKLNDVHPFYSLMSDDFLPIGIIISTAAAIVASQALISGSFTLINEAMRLNLWPKVKVKYPTTERGQLYIPSVNWLLCFGCIGIVLFFEESAKMDAAYGLSIIITMIMTTILLMNFLIMKRYPAWFIYILLITFLFIEISFLIANLVKFQHGGYVTIIMASLLAGIMFIWLFARKIQDRYVEFTKMDKYLPILLQLSNDRTIEKYATHLVYMTGAAKNNEIEEKVIYSILRKHPKRADIYWFVHIDLADEPFCREYKVTQIIHNKIIRIDFKLGFRELPRINTMFRQVVTMLAENKEVDVVSRYESLHRENIAGDFRFVVMKKFLSYENDLPFFEKIVMDSYFTIKQMSLSEEKAFGLDTSNVTLEKVPLIIKLVKNCELTRLD